MNLVSGREEVDQLLKLDHLIDLVIPRGSNQLVSYIQEHTKIPVLGHADGVCHLYIDHSAEIHTAERVLLDGKIDYPTACNAIETVLIHEKLVEDGRADLLLRALRKSNVIIYGGPNAVKRGLTENQLVESNFHIEYSDLKITVEVVASVDIAVDHINRYGSHHTDVIVSEDIAATNYFLQYVDSACVFHNASSRFADGYRFGLGAEVGISTGKIHARGPVGVEGLLTTKWILRSASERCGHVVASNPTTAAVYINDGEPLEFTHKRL